MKDKMQPPRDMSEPKKTYVGPKYKQKYVEKYSTSLQEIVDHFAGADFSTVTIEGYGDGCDLYFVCPEQCEKENTWYDEQMKNYKANQTYKKKYRKWQLEQEKNSLAALAAKHGFKIVEDK